MQDLQVVEQNNEFYVDSREVAEMVGKRHDHLIRDIKGYIEVLEENPNLGTRQFLKRVLTLQIKTKFNLATYYKKRLRHGSKQNDWFKRCIIHSNVCRSIP